MPAAGRKASPRRHEAAVAGASQNSLQKQKVGCPQSQPEGRPGAQAAAPTQALAAASGRVPAPRPLPPSSGSKLVNATLIQRRAVGGPDCPGEARGAQQLPAKATLSAWEPGLQALSSTFYSSSWMRRYVGAGDTHRHRQNEEHAAEHAGLRGRSSHDPGTTLKTP